MTKTFTFLSFFAILLLAVSCNSGGNVSPGIVGPRILEKVDSAGVVQMEIDSDMFGVVQQIQGSANVANSGNLAFYYDANDDLSQITINEGNSLHYDYDYSYDSTGKIISATENLYLNNSVQGEMHSVYTYSGDKVTKIFKKRGAKDPNNPNGPVIFLLYYDIQITYSGENVVLISEKTGGIDPTNGTYEPALQTVDYEFSDFDDKLNPYKTLPTQVITGMGAISHVYLSYFSKNNAKRTRIKFNGLPIYQSPLYTASYDPQNYLIGLQPGNYTYTYKAIQ